MANAQLYTHSPVAGVQSEAVVSVTDTYSAWLIANGYGTPEGGNNPASFSGLTQTSPAAAADPTLAAVRGKPGVEIDLVATAQARVDTSGSRDAVSRGRGKGAVDTQTNQDSFTAIKGT